MAPTGRLELTLLSLLLVEIMSCLGMGGDHGGSWRFTSYFSVSKNNKQGSPNTARGARGSLPKPKRNSKRSPKANQSRNSTQLRRSPRLNSTSPSSDKENNGKANQRTCGKNKNNVQQSDSLALNSHRLELFQKSYQGVQMSPDDKQLFNKVLDHKLGLKGAVDSDHVKTVMNKLGHLYYSHNDTRLRIPLGKVPVSELNPIVDADDVLNPYLAQLTETVRTCLDRDEPLRAMFDPDVKVKEQWVRTDEDHVYLFITCGTGCVHEALHRSFARNMEHSIRDNGLEDSVDLSSGFTRTSKKEPDAAVAVMQGSSRRKRNVVFEGAHKNENLEQLLQEASEAFISNDSLNYFVGAKLFDETKRAETGVEPSMFAMVVERKKRKRREIDDSIDSDDEMAKENYKKFKEGHSADEDVDVGSIVFAAHMGRGEMLERKLKTTKEMGPLA